MKNLLALAVVLSLSGCSTLVGSSAEKVAIVVAEYCSFSPTARAAYHAVVNEHTAPHIIAIECEGDL